jgi:hypothetical protein
VRNSAGLGAILVRGIAVGEEVNMPSSVDRPDRPHPPQTSEIQSYIGKHHRPLMIVRFGILCVDMRNDFYMPSNRFTVIAQSTLYHTIYTQE